MSEENTLHALGMGVGTKDSRDNWLEVFYPAPFFRPAISELAGLLEMFGWQEGKAVIPLGQKQLQELTKIQLPDIQADVVRQLQKCLRPCVLTLLHEDSAVQSTPEAYLKLHLLSHLYCKPNEQNLEGIFACLPNVAWTSRGAMAPEDLPEAQLAARCRNEYLEVMSVDKFPRMTDYVVPRGVRIAHAARVRLGAYLGGGTTVMHEGFVNFNAGALGPGMIEGRISQGVTIGRDSDLGGSASTIGTLSGGNKTVISIGEECLIGANAGTGIPLGDRCTIEAGLYITAGMPLLLVRDGQTREVRARELAGESDLLFIRNGRTGAVECRVNPQAISLNPSLHQHN